MCRRALTRIQSFVRLNDPLRLCERVGHVTVDVSRFLIIQHRAQKVVPERLKQIEAAILRKDFEAFAKITMQVVLHVALRV